MKLLVYSHYFAPSVGGVETIVLSLARGLSERRDANGAPAFEVTVVTHTAPKDYDDDGLPFRIVRRPSLAKLWKLIRSAEVIHVAGASLAPLFLAWIARKPVVLEHHGYQSICLNGLLIHQPERSICPGHFLAGNYRECQKCSAKESSTARSWLALLLMFPRYLLTKKAAANLTISKHFLHTYPLPRSALSYYGIEDPLPGSARSENGAAASGKIQFAYVGRLVEEKGIPVLLEAARLLREEGYAFDVRLIGDGPQRPKLEEIMLRDNLGSLVEITGFLRGAEFAKAVEDVRVVVMPSVWLETAGLAAIEQMMRGRLVIASDVAGLGEVVGEAGLKCFPGDAAGLAAQMRRVLNDPSLIETYGRTARERALQLFRRESFLADHARVYEEVFSRKKIQAP